MEATCPSAFVPTWEASSQLSKQALCLNTECSIHLGGGVCAQQNAPQCQQSGKPHATRMASGGRGRSWCWGRAYKGQMRCRDWLLGLGYTSSSGNGPVHGGGSACTGGAMHGVYRAPRSCVHPKRAHQHPEPGGVSALCLDPARPRRAEPCPPHDPAERPPLAP